VSTQCPGVSAQFYILNTHGSGKYECLSQSGTTISGSHYTSWLAYWGTIEYRLISSDSSCPTPSPTPSPTPVPDMVSGVGDPHLTNIAGEHFDIYQPGNLTLIRLPQHADSASTLLLVEADARRMGGVCSVYFQVVVISGLWTNQSSTIRFLASAHGTPIGTDNKLWMRFGTVDLKVTRHKKGIEYLNVHARNVGHTGYAVGGLLGSDSHAFVATRPRECAHKHTAVLSRRFGAVYS